MTETEKIQCISFPRSGHHLLVRCLTQMYGEHFQYCDFYNHCRKTPCRNAKTNFQKNHDFKLNLSFPETQRCLIQYRHPIESISSWFELALTEPNLWERVTLRDNQNSWETFFNNKLSYWKQFIEKWVLQPDAKRQMLVPYHLLVQNPVKQLTQIAEFIWPSVSVPEFKFDWVLKIQEIAPKRTALEFRHCSHAWIEKMENELEDYLVRAAIPRLVSD